MKLQQFRLKNKYVNYDIKLWQKNNISIKKLLADAGLGNNAMANMKTSMPKSDSLAKQKQYENKIIKVLTMRIKMRII